LDLMLLGFPAAAQRQGACSLQEAEDLSHPTSLCFAHSIATRVQLIARDGAALAEHAGRVLRLANEQGLELWQALGSVYRGWARVDAGELAPGIELMRQGLARYRALGARLSVPYYLAILATAQATAGEHGEALDLLAEALRVSEAGAERWAEAEIH